jgi:hypothetical protein
VIREIMSIMNIVNGRRVWKNEAGQIHREDGPAIEYDNGSKEWYIRDRLHNENGPAIEYVSIGGKQWWIHGQFHRVDGPAYEYTNGDKIWFVYGRRHRVDGPAYEYTNGNKEWWVYGRQSSKQNLINLLVQYDMKLRMIPQILPPGSEILVYKYAI